MKAGGSSHKGGAFERYAAVALSRWLSDGEYADLLTRNEGSGSRHTVTGRRGTACGVPGDLMLSRPHALAITFLERVMVECKHYREIFLEQFLYRPQKTWLTAVLTEAFTQACAAQRGCFAVIKENRRPPLLFTTEAVALALEKSSDGVLHHHRLARSADGAIYVSLFEEALAVSCPHRFLDALRPSSAASPSAKASAPSSTPSLVLRKRGA